MSMPDEADLAQDHIEKTLTMQIAEASTPKVKRATGACLNCDEPVGEGQLYCDEDCRVDSLRVEAARLRGGTP